MYFPNQQQQHQIQQSNYNNILMNGHHCPNGQQNRPIYQNISQQQQNGQPKWSQSPIKMFPFEVEHFPSHQRQRQQQIRQKQIKFPDSGRTSVPVNFMASSNVTTAQQNENNGQNVYFAKSFGQAAIPLNVPQQQSSNSLPIHRYVRRIKGGRNRGVGEDGGRQHNDVGGEHHQWPQEWGQWQQQYSSSGRAHMPGQQLFSTNNPPPGIVFSSSLPEAANRQRQGQPSSMTMGPREEGITWRAFQGSDHQPAWPKLANTQQQRLMKINRMTAAMGKRAGKSWKDGEGESANNFGAAAPPNRSNQSSQPTSSINRHENSGGGTDLYRWWSSETERSKQRRRQGGGSAEPPIQRGSLHLGPSPSSSSSFERIVVEGNKSHHWEGGGENQFIGSTTIGNDAHGNQARKRTTTTIPTYSIPSASIGGQSAEGAVADPEAADLLFAYAQNHRQNSRPNSLIAEAPFLNRSKTVPVIKFRYREEEKEKEEQGNQFEERKEAEGNGTLLSPVSRSQNLLQAAINSLDNQQQKQHFEATTIKVSPKNNNSFALAELFEGDFRAKTLPAPLKSTYQKSEEESAKTQTEEFARLFQELGFDLNKSISKNLSAAFGEEEMSKTTSNWKNSFAAMKEKFGGSMESENGEIGPQMPTFSTKGEEIGWNNSPVVKSSPIQHQQDGKRRSNPENNYGGSQRITNTGRRPSQQSSGSKDISNFWLQMLKSRAEANQSPQPKMTMGLNAAERLQQLQQEAQQEEANRQSPASAASSSAGSSSAAEWATQQQKYPYRKAGGVESVAMRRNNFLAQVQRIESPSMFGGGGSTASGRTTPLMLKTLKSVSPSMELMQNNNNGPMNDGMGKPKGCGRFPTEQIEIGPKQHHHSPNESEASSTMSSSSRPSLPQPAPKHNIRDQLINAGYRLSRQTASSFFGGAANNPFFGQQNVAHSSHSPQFQHRHPPSHQQPMPFRSNSPNFPATNTVIARISELENKQQQQQHSLQNCGQFFQQQSLQFQNLNIRLPPSNSPIIPSNAGQLSPRSTVFRTKPIIFLDDDQQQEKLPKNQHKWANKSTMIDGRPIKGDDGNKIGGNVTKQQKQTMAIKVGEH